MELKEPRKKAWKPKDTQNCPLPLVYQGDGTLKKYLGSYNGYSIIVERIKDMQALNSMGVFGKGNQSRCRPAPTKDVEILRERQYLNRKKHFKSSNNPRKVLVVPDSGDEAEDYFVGLRVRYELERSLLKETLNLLPEEAFFLLLVGCLDIHDDRLLTPETAWSLFCEADHLFVRNYIVYHYYRSKNWVVRSGIKFAGDYVLYKESPESFHASYVVVIDVIDEDGLRLTKFSGCSDIKRLHGLNRLCETAGKELLICQIVWPKNVQIKSPNDITEVTIKEILMKRWRAGDCKDDET